MNGDSHSRTFQDTTLCSKLKGNYKRHKEAERTITWATQQEKRDTQVTKMAHKGEFQGLGLCALPAMAQVQSLVREPRSLKWHGAAK